MLSVNGTKTCRDVAWDFALTSQMNVTYYQQVVDRLLWWDTLTRLVAGVAASATLVTFFRQNTLWGVDVATIMGLLAAICGIVGATLRIPDKARALGVLLAEYTAHTQTFERLFQFGCTDESVSQALEAFGKTEQLEAKDHPKPNDSLMKKSRELVLERIGAAA